MLVHLYFTDAMLFDMVRFRILDAYIPWSNPIDFLGTPIFFDGLENVAVRAAEVAHPPRTSNFILNVVGPASLIVPAPGATTATVPNVTLRIDADLFAVEAATLADPSYADPDPASGVYALPATPPRLKLSLADSEAELLLTVSSAGDPVLHVNPYKFPLGLGVSGLGTIAVPLPLAGPLGGVVEPSPVHILNAGIAPTFERDGFVIRLEIDEPALPSLTQRAVAWSDFFAGKQRSALGQRSWAVELPTAFLLQTAAGKLDDEFDKPDIAKIFREDRPSWGQWTVNQAQFALHTSGVFPHACSGLDIGADFIFTATLSVPQPGTLRFSVNIDVSRDAWDTFKCVALSLVNPLAGLITAVDFGAPWYLVIPTALLFSALIPPLIFVLALTGNSLAVMFALQQAQDQLQSNGVIRTDDTDVYVDLALPAQSLGPAQLSVQEVAGNGDLLVIRGGYTEPDSSPLYLTGTLAEGFDFWAPVDECASAPTYETSATLALALRVTRDPASRATVAHPGIAIKYGFDTTANRTFAWRVIDDPQNAYSGVNARVEWSGVGVPGLFQVIVDSPPEPFADAPPYPLHLQFYTSYGVRQFNVPAPPPLPKPPPTNQGHIAWQAERISRCYTRSSLAALIKILQIGWLPDPQPDAPASRHWQIWVGGLAPENWLRAWDARGTLLAEARAWGGDFAELSLITTDPQIRLLQVTLDNQEPLPAAEYLRRSAEVKRNAKDAPTPIRLRQSLLVPLATIALPNQCDAIRLQSDGQRLTITAWDREGAWLVRLPGLAAAGWSIVRAAQGSPIPLPSLPSRLMRLVATNRDGREVTLVLADGDSEIGRFFARPWYDRGSVAGGYYARLDATQTSVELYARTPPRIAAPLIA
jgi:hypothetical protein